MNRNRILFFVLSAFAIFCANAQEVRSYTGEGNNIQNPFWGAAHQQLIRSTTVDYEDGVSTPAGSNRLNPREISNLLFDQQDRIDDFLKLSDFVWVFGQFVDHDLSLVENFDMNENPEEGLIILPPFGDSFFGPGDFIPMMRSKATEGTGTSVDNPRQHDNEISSFIDASAVYGSSKYVADWLRTFENGKLKVSENGNLPWNTLDGEFNSPVDVNAPVMETGGFIGQKFYIAGDVRANENPLLLAMHTLFVREHNLVCDEIIAENNSLNDEEIYQLARKIVGGKLQSIIYGEWLPAMNVRLPAYTGYNPNINPGISNVFSAAAFRMGHTLINSNIIRMRNDGEVISRGNISLKDAFFNPLAVDLAGGIDPYIKGMGTQIQQDFDCKVVSDVRNFLFGAPGQGGLDLAAININRGRERGIADYNTVRNDFGLPRIEEFSDLCDDPEISNLLEEIYLNMDDIDPWVGMLAEIHMNDALFGELVMTIMERQFRALRDGDRFYFENDSAISEKWKQIIRETKMHDIIMRNTSIDLMQTEVFRAMPHDEIPTGPEIEYFDLSMAIYPNPVADHMYIKVVLESDENIEVEIINDAGLVVESRTIQGIQGENSFYLEIDDAWPTGIYNCRLSTPFNFNIKRFFKN